MKSLRKVVLVLLTVTALSAAVVSPAAAAPEAPVQAPAPAPALICEGGTCQLAGNAAGLLGFLRGGANLALTQLPFETKADGEAQATLDVKKDITLSLPVGEVTLTNARLQVEVGKGGKITRLNGTADMPFPTFGLLDDVRIVTPARANVGLDLGKNLPDMGFELDPDRPYLFFSTDTAADSAMDVTGRTAGKADAFSLSFAPGQRATLVIDTVEPVAYLDGHVTLAGIDQIALLGGLLESTPIAEYVPDTLPLRERTQFGLSGKFSKDLAESRLTLSGAYLLDAGILPARLGIEAQMLNLQGKLTVGRDGVLVDGVLKSAVEPDKLFDGGARVEVFVPFSKVAGPSYAGVDASVKAPAVNLGVGAGAKAGAGKYELSGQLSTPFTDSDLAGKVTGDLPDVAGAVGPVVGQAAGAVGSAAGTVGSAAGKAAAAVGTTTGKATAAVGTGAGKAAGFVGPVAGRTAWVVSGYARSGLDLAGAAIKAGKAKLSRDATPAPTTGPTPVAP
jgi:hypothetical protein